MNDTQKIQHPQSVREFTGDYNGHTLTIRYYYEDRRAAAALRLAESANRK